MNLKPSVARVLALGALVLATDNAVAAAVVSLSPSAQTVTLGSSTTVAVQVSGLSPNAAPTLMAFNFSLVYNPAVLNATGVTFGDGFDLGLNGSVQIKDISFPGNVHAFEVSLEDSGPLEAFQSLPANIPLTLFTIEFETIGLGTSDIIEHALAGNGLDDSNLDDISYSFETASITVIPTGAPPNEVPEASTTVAALALCGGVGRFAWRRARATRS